MNIPDPGNEPGSPALQADSLPTELSRKPFSSLRNVQKGEFLNAASYNWRAALIAQLTKNLPAMQETPVQLLGQEDPLEKG